MDRIDRIILEILKVIWLPLFLFFPVYFFYEDSTYEFHEIIGTIVNRGSVQHQMGHTKTIYVRIPKIKTPIIFSVPPGMAVKIGAKVLISKSTSSSDGEAMYTIIKSIE